MRMEIGAMSYEWFRAVFALIGFVGFMMALTYLVSKVFFHVKTRYMKSMIEHTRTLEENEDGT